MPDTTASAFTVQQYLRDRFDEVGRKLRFQGSTAQDAEKWQAESRETLKKLIGLDTMRTCPLEPKITEEVDCGEYTRERVELEVEPGLLMPVYVLTPKAGFGPYPVMLNPHGHGGGGKAATAGVGGDPRVEEQIKHYNYAYGERFCKAGFVSMCPDARGFGERMEAAPRAKNDPLRQSCQEINHMALPLGQTVTGMWVWDLMRLIDYAETREDCDTSRLGCAGLSGGGLQTLWVSALDERIHAAVVSGYCYGVKQSLLDMHLNCSCNYVPHLWEYADHGDLAGLIAPRPLMIQTGDEDSLNGADGLDNVRPQIELARKVYAAYGAADRLVHDIFHGPHRWDDTNSIPFMEKVLGA